MLTIFFHTQEFNQYLPADDTQIQKLPVISDTSVQIPVINVQLPDMSKVVSNNNEVPATRDEEILTADLWESVNIDWTQDLWMDDASANKSTKAVVTTEVRKKDHPCRT